MVFTLFVAFTATAFAGAALCRGDMFWAFICSGIVYSALALHEYIRVLDYAKWVEHIKRISKPIDPSLDTGSPASRRPNAWDKAASRAAVEARRAGE